MKTMDEWRADFKSQDFVGTYKRDGLQQCYSAISDWIASHREKILLAWWAEYGFEPGLAICVEDRTDGELRYYVRKSTAQERERAKTTTDSASPELPQAEEVIDSVREKMGGWVGSNPGQIIRAVLEYIRVRQPRA